MIGVPCIPLGNYLVQSRAMFLANAYLERSQCLASRQTFICAADRFICSRRQKNGHFLCLSALFHKEIMIIQNRYADKKIYSVCKGKTFAHRPMRICVSVYFLKKSQPEHTCESAPVYSRYSHVLTVYCWLFYPLPRWGDLFARFWCCWGIVLYILCIITIATPQPPLLAGT